MTQHLKIKHGRCSICGRHGNDCTGSEYPEHDKLKAISEYSQQIGAFLEWMKSDGIRLSRPHVHTRDCDNNWCDYDMAQLVHDNESIQDRLARYFEIDQNKLDHEKREMLAAIRMEHAKDEIRKELAL